MNYNFNFKPGDGAMLLSFFITIAALWLYLGIIKSSLTRKFNEDINDPEKGIIRHTLRLHVASLVLLGILPLFIFMDFNKTYHLNKLGITLVGINVFETLKWIVSPALPIIMIGWYVSKSKMSFKHYPELRIPEWDRKLIIKSAFGSIIYTTGVEILFRGIFLFPIVNSIGVWPAILLNAVVFGLFITNNGKELFLQGVILGFVFCITTLKTQTIVPAVILHSAYHITRNLVAFYYNPEFRMVERRIPTIQSNCELGCKCHPVDDY